MYLVLQSFGRETEYKRAILSILSFIGHTSLPKNEAKVLLFTDRPEYFSDYLDGLSVKYILLTAEKIIDMRGKIDFLHRIKIAVIDEAFAIANDNLLYADSDTFFTSDPSPLMKQLAPDKSFMHELEYRFEELRKWDLPMAETFIAFLNLIESQTFTLNDGQMISVTPQLVSWNAGVMMFHSSHKKYIPDVYALTDQFYPKSINHASEQYAFSIMLQNNTIVQACNSICYHYWYRVKKQIIDGFLANELHTAWAKQKMEDKLIIIKNWTRMLPTFFDTHVLTIRDKAIQSFSEKDYRNGYKWTVKALRMNPFGDKKFIKDVLYYTKNLMLRK